MSKLIVKGPEIFFGIRNAIHEFNCLIPDKVHQIILVINQLFESVEINLRETENQIDEKQTELRNLELNANTETSESQNDDSSNTNQINELNREINRLQQKFYDLQGSYSRVKFMKDKVNTIQRNIENDIHLSQKGIQALLSFEEISNQYLNIQKKPNTNSSTNSTNGQPKGKIAKMVVGDTIHATLNQNYINQVDIDNLLTEIKGQFYTHNPSVRKLSFEKINSSNRSLFEKNGFTIQEIKPNVYSAYIEIDN